MVIDTVVVDNFELIKSLMHFESDGDFYLLQILQRRKENPEMESARAYVVKSYYIRSIDHLNKLENEIREFCKIFSARAYISPSAKNWKNVSKIAVKKSLDYIFEGKETLMDKVIESSAAESIPKNKLWVVDIDTTDEKVTGVNVVEVEVTDVKEIRLKLNMTQEQFSSTFRIPSGTVKGWEQKRRGMDATSAAFLRVIEKYPEQVKDALRSTLAQA